MTLKGTSVLVATDLSARSDRAVDRAILFARQRGLEPKVLHVASEKDTRDEIRIKQDVRNVLPDPDANIAIALRRGAAPEAIAKFSIEENCALIVTGVARLNEFRDYFLGTAIDYLLREADAPVLIVKQRPHRPYGRIAVLTDFSELSRTALITAASLLPDAKLTLVHAYRAPFETRLDSEELRELAKTTALNDMRAFVDSKDIAEDVRRRLEERVVHGSIQSALDEVIASDRPDLIALGAKGQSALAHVALGSTAQLLLPWVETDTLVVLHKR